MDLELYSFHPQATPAKSSLSLIMKTVLERYRVDGVWHFTDRSNLALIQQQGGILSLRELNQRGIEVPVPGGNQWSHDADEMKGVHDYVHLAFVAHHPMLYVATKEARISDPVWLKIDCSVLFEKGVRFTSDVSNKAGVEILSAEEAVDRIDFEILFTRTDWKDPAIRARRQAAEKSEILIPRIVPKDKIVNL